MNNPKTLIIKIALGVSVAAFIFSVVTLIRNIVIGNLVFISVMQVIGAGLIVGIVLGFVSSIIGILGIITGLVGGVFDLYCFVAIVLAVLQFLGMLKN